MTTSIFCDGASRGNPGPASYGVWVEERGRAAWGEGRYLGASVSNNVAEWKAFIRGLELVVEMFARATNDVAEVNVYSDSDLVVKQWRGEYRTEHADLVPLRARARALGQYFAPNSVRVRHIFREANVLADRMANEALDRRAVVQSRIEFADVVTADPTEDVSSQIAPVPQRKAKKRKS